MKKNICYSYCFNNGFGNFVLERMQGWWYTGTKVSAIYKRMWTWRRLAWMGLWLLYGIDEFVS